MGRALVAALVGAFVAMPPRSAHACSEDPGVEGARPDCLGFPEGAFIIADAPPVSADTVAWTEDQRISAILARTATETEGSVSFKAYRRLGPGSAQVRHPSYRDGRTCTVEVIGPAGDPPPPIGELDVTADYAEGGSDGNGCMCGELEYLHLTPKRAPASAPAYVVAWFGTSEGEVTASRDPDAMYGPFAGRPMTEGDSERRLPPLDFFLGTADYHERSGKGFRREGRYCFTLGFMDALGRTGDRSVPTCIDTTNPDDPLVNREDRGFCICDAPGSSGRRSRGALGSCLLAVLVALGRRRIGRRPSASST